MPESENQKPNIPNTLSAEAKKTSPTVGAEAQPDPSTLGAEASTGANSESPTVAAAAVLNQAPTLEVTAEDNSPDQDNEGGTVKTTAAQDKKLLNRFDEGTFDHLNLTKLGDALRATMRLFFVLLKNIKILIEEYRKTKATELPNKVPDDSNAKKQDTEQSESASGVTLQLDDIQANLANNPPPPVLTVDVTQPTTTNSATNVPTSSQPLVEKKALENLTAKPAKLLAQLVDKFNNITQKFAQQSATASSTSANTLSFDSLNSTTPTNEQSSPPVIFTPATRSSAGIIYETFLQQVKDSGQEPNPASSQLTQPPSPVSSTTPIQRTSPRSLHKN